MSVPRDMELRRLRSEIDERRNAIHQILSEGIWESPLPDDLSSEAPTSIPPEHVEFFKRLYRHTDLETIRDGVGGNSDSVNRELSNLAEPLELLTRRRYEHSPKPSRSKA
jgi:hypothetical protein